MADLRSQLQQTFGSAYSVERELGGGGMSRVFVARDTTLERNVVVKVLSPELAAGVSADRFTREIRVAASLQQANIVPVLAAGATLEGLPYYTMPFVEGQSLRSRLARDGALPVTDVIGILRDVSKALAYAHERGVVHRDIKPDNVLLSGGTAVVTDFGIAKALSASRTDSGGGTLTQLGTSIGTPAYMAPEQAAGDPQVDHRADIYALGCMAYELLAGRGVFSTRTPQRMLAAHMTETPQHVSELRPDTPAALAELVMKCLAKEAAARPQSALEIARILETVTSGGGHPAMPPILIGGAGMMRKALALYALAFMVVAVVARAAILAIGLPEWVFPGALIVMALGLPVILFTGYVHRTTRRAITATPKLTPGGTPSLQHGTMATLALKASPHMSWRRTLMGGIYAIGGFVALIGGFMLLRSMGIGPAGSLLAAGRLSDRERLLVTDFRVTNADTTLGRVLSDAARTQLAQSSVITLMSPEGLADALRRMTRPVNTTLDLPLARELAQRNGIRGIVDGEITGIGDSYILSMKLVTADSARELASFRQTASSAAGLIDAVDVLARQLRGRIGESLKRVNATTPLAAATTSSLDALRKYTEGMRAEELLGKRQEAIALFREAVAIDSGFAQAWRKMAVAMSNGGYPQAQIDSALVQAYRHRHRVTGWERDFIEAYYFDRGPERNRQRAADAYEKVLRAGDSIYGPNNLALIESSRRRFARAESLYLARERHAPGAFRLLYSNLSLVQVHLQKFAAAESTLALGIRHNIPDLEEPLDRLRVDVRYLKGDTAGYRRGIDSALAQADSAGRVWAMGKVALQAAQDGRVAEFRRLASSARPPAARATPQQRLNWAAGPNDAWIIAKVANRPDEVARALDAAVAAYPMQATPANDRPWLSIARAYAIAGQPAKARAALARYDAEVRDPAARQRTRPGRSDAFGEILLAEGKGAEAIAHFRDADMLPDGPANACVVCLSQRLARAFDQSGQVDSAIVHYERALHDYYAFRMNGGDDPRFRAVFTKRLGELYEQQGNAQRAAKYYRDFVGLWKNADPELQPQVADVRRRLSRLADVEARP